MPRVRDRVLQRAYAAAWKRRNPEKAKAHDAVRHAILRGRLERRPCHCGSYGEAHHENYDAPLDVVWLCRKHHVERHRQG